MNNKKSFLIIAIVLILLIAGASLLYTRLGSDFAPGQLTGEHSQKETTHDSSAAGQTDADSAPNESSPSGDDTARETEGQAADEEKVLAPDFTVYDLEGTPHRLSDFRGKPVVLNFWASWCGPCKSEMPDFEIAYQEYGKDIHFLIVNMTDGSRETVESASAYITENMHTFPVYYDTDYSAAYAYSVYSLPATYFIDADGYAVAHGRGALDLETLKTGIAMITK